MNRERIVEIGLVAMFIATITAVLPVDAYLKSDKAKLPGRAPFRKVAAIETDEWYDGRGGTKLEQQWMNESYVGRWLTQHHNELVYRTTRRTTPASWLGKDMWLFVPQRVHEFHQSHWDTLVRFDVDAIEAVDREVRSRKAKLVVALVPDRARIYPERAYVGGAMPSGKAGFLPAIEAGLRERGITVVNLTAALEQQKQSGPPPFYPEDHHWTSTGAKAGAEAIRDALPKELAALLEPTLPAAPYRVIWNDAAASESSLTRKLGFVPDGELEKSFRRSEPRVRMLGQGARDFPSSCATYWATSYGLFGSPQFFANQVRCPVRVIMRAGTGSSWAPLRDLPQLANARDLHDRHLVVWEIPEYHLVEPEGQRPDAFVRIHRRYHR